MKRGGTLGLWIAAGVMLAATVGLYFYEPEDTGAPISDTQRTQLDAAVAKAATYYEFGHYARAVESYRTAIERGMDDAVESYRYAHAVELSGGDYLSVYAHAYELLLEQAPQHEYRAAAEARLAEEATTFDYEAFSQSEPAVGTLVELQGTVSRVVWGRVESHRDTLYVATREDEWLGHSGEEVVVEIPRHRRYRAGDTLRIIGFYSGRCSRNTEAGISREYFCVEAVGARMISP